MTTRWNGWGDDNIEYPISNNFIETLIRLLGNGGRFEDAPIDRLLQSIPESKLSNHPLVSTDSLIRLTHTRGQSLPDWIGLRYGNIVDFTDGVATPQTDEDVAQLIKYAYQNEVALIPYGGGTSVLGHINPILRDMPNLTVDLSGLNKLHNIDVVSRLATLGAGCTGPRVEYVLNKYGYTLGHFPQSFEYSTLGGWIATRSCGQQSDHYGRIENMVRGCWIETPLGTYKFPPIPPSAAGPDMLHAILGSEGRAGIITRATVRINPVPEHEAFYGIFFRDWESGLDALKDIAQQKVPVSMLRLSDPQETEFTLSLSGNENLLRWAERGLQALKYGNQRCLLIVGITSRHRSIFSSTLGQAKAIIRRNGGLFTGTYIGRKWEESRFYTPYLRNTLWEYGYAVDTLETSLVWNNVGESVKAIKASIHEAMASLNQRILAFSHVSHVYPEGASLYFTCIFPRSKDPLETLTHWQTFKSAASEAIINHAGTISHQHGVGLDHLDFMDSEKGEIVLGLLDSIFKYIDPKQLMNPGKLLPSKIRYRVNE